MDPVLIAAVAAVLGVVVATFRIRNRVRRSDLDRLERKLDSVIHHLGLEQELLPKASDRVKTHLSAGDVIGAIRAYREDNPGISLKEAAETIEELRKAMRDPR